MEEETAQEAEAERNRMSTHERVRKTFMSRFTAYKRA
jgi:hypothetical protein